MSARGLTVGDALAVGALLVFIVAYLVLLGVYVWWRTDTGSLPSNPDDWSVMEGVGLTCLAWLPPLWASGLVKRVAAGPWSER